MQISGQQQTRLVRNASFLAFIESNTNELLVYDARGFTEGQSKAKPGAGEPKKMRCIARMKPQIADDGQSTKDGPQVKYTCVAFCSQNPNESQLMVGTSNGLVGVISCNEGKHLRYIHPTTSHASVVQMRLLSPGKVLILTLHKLLIFDFEKEERIRVLASAHKQKTKASGDKEKGDLLQTKAQTSVPQFFDVSPDQNYTVEVGNQRAQGQQENVVVHLRDLITNKILVQFEGHGQNITNVAFIANKASGMANQKQAFLSCTRSGECILWEVPEVDQKKVQKVLQPPKIFDIECADQIDYVTGCKVMLGAFLVTAISEQKQFVFLTKMDKKQKDGSQKSRVKRVDTVVTPREQSHQLLYTHVVNDTQVQTVYGNALQLLQVNVNIIDDGSTADGSKSKKGGEGEQARTSILKSIQLPSLAQGQASKKAKTGAEEDYDVAGYEDQRQADAQAGTIISLFDVNQFKASSDSRKTSASTALLQQQITKHGGGSLTTILKQSLVSEDQEQLDWVLSQRDSSMIEQTLLQLNGQKDQKTITLLFKRLLEKLQLPTSSGQSQFVQDQLALSLWLKHALKIHWSTLVVASAQKKQTATECLQSLQGLKYMIDCKTQQLSQLLVVKGKLEMLKNCQQMQLASYHAKVSASATLGERFSKIKKNIEKSKQTRDALAEDEEMNPELRDDDSDDSSQKSILLYKDVENAGQNADILDMPSDHSDDDEEEESDFDEEIEKLDAVTGKKLSSKRQRVGEEYDEEDDNEDDEDAMMGLGDYDDEDASQEEIPSGKPAKKQKQKQVDKKPKGFDVQYSKKDIDGEEDDDDDDLSQGALARKLVEDSDEENALQAAGDDDDESDSEML